MDVMGAEFENYWNKHIYLDSGKKLTSKNIQDMSWLSNGGLIEDKKEIFERFLLR